MAVRVIFRCEHCNAVPDPATQRTLQGQLLVRTFGEYHHAEPGGWLIWTGSGPLGGKRYACARHSTELMVQTGRDYGAIHGAAAATQPHETLWPDGLNGFDERAWAGLLSA